MKMKSSIVVVSHNFTINFLLATRSLEDKCIECPHRSELYI